MNKEKSIDRVVLGAAGLGGTWRKIDPEKSVESILFALEQGINHIDMAPAYMDAEIIVARALKQWNGPKPFLSTKVGKKKGMAWDTGLSDYRPSALEESILRSMERLDLDQIDLLFLHEPEELASDKISQTINCLLTFKQKGYIKKLGLGGHVSNAFHPYIREGVFDVAMDFNRYNLVQRNVDQTDIPFLKTCGLEIYEASPLMMGLLGRRLKKYAADPPAWLEINLIQKALKLEKLATNYGMSLPEMAQRFLFFNSNVDKVVIGPANLEQLKSTVRDYNKGPLPAMLMQNI